MAQKGEEFGVSTLQEGYNVTVHGVMVEVSPIKPSKKNPDVKYFSGKISDGNKVVRMISFDPKLRTALDKSKEEKKTVALVNCNIRESKFDESGLEIVTNSCTKVEHSPDPKRFKIDTANIEKNFITELDISSLDEISSLSINQRINVSAKVISVGQLEEVTSKSTSRQLVKQECRISDSIGSARIVLWENDVNKLREEFCYRFSNVTVREYGCEKYLSLSEMSEIQKIDDIGEVVLLSDDEDSSQGGNNLVEGEIVAILTTNEYYSCISCKGKVTTVNGVIGECGKCHAKMKLKSLSAKFILECSSGKQLCLTAFNEQVQDIVADQSTALSIEERMLSITTVKLFVSRGIVKSVKLPPTLQQVHIQ